MSRMEPRRGATSGTRRVLFVSDERGWPRTSGYRRRTAQLLRSVAELGPTTWVVALRNRYDTGTPVVVPPELDGHVDVVQVPAPTRPRWQTAGRWAATNLPWPLAAGDWAAVDRALRTLDGTRFDLIWAMGIDALSAVRRSGLQAATIVVDADLESLKLQRRLESGSAGGRLKRAVATVDVGRWRQLESHAANTADGFSVCSEVERCLLGGRAFVTANSYSIVGPTTDRAESHAGPDGVGSVLLFVGSLGYEPNLDGLRWFTVEILPAIRARDRRTRLRVVGTGGDDVSWLGQSEGVDVIGEVDDVGAELAAADAVVVPLRWGAGTRIKILEAFAHGVPVVSTTLGAEGLEVEHERELLIADDAASFASACCRVIEQPQLSRTLSRHAFRTFMSGFEESVVRNGLIAQLTELIEAAAIEAPLGDR